MAASEQIKEAVCDAGNSSAICGYCGKQHFDETGHGLKDAELKAWRRAAKDHPAKVAARQGSVGIGMLEGTLYVQGCGCAMSEDRLLRIERFLLEHAELIHRYFALRAAALKKEAEKLERFKKGEPLE